MTHSDIHPPSSIWEEKQVQLEKLVASACGNDPSYKSYDSGSQECDDEWTGWNSDTGKERSHEDSECPSDKSYDPKLKSAMTSGPVEIATLARKGAMRTASAIMRNGQALPLK